MNDKQNAKQNMQQAVLHILREYAETYANIPAFNDAVNELTELVGQIDQTARQQSKTTLKSASNEKNEAETTLVTETIKIANAMYTMSMVNNNLALLPKVTVTKSMLYKAQNNETLNIARRIAAEATAHTEALKYYGIEQKTLEALNTAIEQYESLIAKPRAVISGTKQSTSNLVHLFAQADTILNDRLDKLMSLFKTGSPEFYAVYFNARNIINTGTRKKKQNE